MYGTNHAKDYQGGIIGQVCGPAVLYRIWRQKTRGKLENVRDLYEKKDPCGSTKLNL